MGDLIDRQEAIREINEWQKTFSLNGHRETVSDLYLVRDEIASLPSAQQEIIKCKECGYRDAFYCAGATKPRLMCTYHIGQQYVVDEDDFCSKAERGET